ncbi:TIGR00296 family protein [Candidatus Woesearchaeota archaeon]|nr:TIGR00296 family protein [Candidatus Woesearchaeota archaeon]
MIKLEQAKKLIMLARNAISVYFKGKETTVSDEIKKEFGEDCGVFVSLYIRDDLIGCIGIPRPIMPLYKAVIQAAKGAAFEDPRFPPLREDQFDSLRVEISVLTEPDVIEIEKPEDYLKKIEIGKDGLMIKDEFGSGLLLPQVAVEWKWNAKEFLNQTCRKAGLEPDCWCNTKRNVYKFQAQVFAEENGKIVEKKLY